jgi:hypothetical protein
MDNAIAPYPPPECCCFADDFVLWAEDALLCAAEETVSSCLLSVATCLFVVATSATSVFMSWVADVAEA